MAKKISILLFLLVLYNTGIYSQQWKLKRYRLSIGIAAGNYFGDIGMTTPSTKNMLGIKTFNITQTRPAYTLGAAYKLHEKFDIKLNFINGTLSGTDKGSPVKKRNGSFTTSIFEPSAQINYFFYQQQPKGGSGKIFNRRGMLNNFSKFNAYGFSGAGMVFFNPQNVLPLNLRASQFSHNGLTFCAGLGLIYVISSKIEVNLEAGGRITSTDYLDGILPLNSKRTDLYSITSFTVCYRIKTDRKGRPVFDLFKRF